MKLLNVPDVCIQFLMILVDFPSDDCNFFGCFWVRSCCSTKTNRFNITIYFKKLKEIVETIRVMERGKKLYNLSQIPFSGFKAQVADKNCSTLLFLIMDSFFSILHFYLYLKVKVLTK